MKVEDTAHGRSGCVGAGRRSGRTRARKRRRLSDSGRCRRSWPWTLRARRRQLRARPVAYRHTRLVTPGQFCAELTGRLVADLQVRFDNVTAAVVEADDWWRCEVREDGQPWGLVSMPIGPGEDEDISPDEAQEMLVSVFEDMMDNQWPDELTEPWPACPKHRYHPLHPKVIRGRGCWGCLYDDSVAIPLGELASATPEIGGPG